MSQSVKGVVAIALIVLVGWALYSVINPAGMGLPSQHFRKARGPPTPRSRATTAVSPLQPAATPPAATSGGLPSLTSVVPPAAPAPASPVGGQGPAVAPSPAAAITAAEEKALAARLGAPPDAGQLSKKDSASYWESRYKKGGNSGAGTYGVKGDIKAHITNRFIRKLGIQEVVEMGFGDGYALGLGDYKKYVGTDVSMTALKKVREMYKSDPSKQFFRIRNNDPPSSFDPAIRGEFAISMEVVFHLTEPIAFENYMKALFSVGSKYVMVMSTNKEDASASIARHVRHWRFVERSEPWFANEWALLTVQPFPFNILPQAFYFFCKRGEACKKAVEVLDPSAGPVPATALAPQQHGGWATPLVADPSAALTDMQLLTQWHEKWKLDPK